MADVLERVFYGVWLRGKGWLKVDNGGFMDCYSDTNRCVVEDTAQRFHGEVRFIDTSLARLEPQIIEQEKADEMERVERIARQLAEERRPIWHTFKTWFDSLLPR